MKLASLFLILFSLDVAAQRVEFNDPDLTFSFVKPTGWIVQDGPTVFVIPENESLTEPTTFFSITYFEDPEKPEEATIELFDKGEIEPSIPPNLKEFKAGEVSRVYIANETALWTSYYHTQNGNRIKCISYVFMKLNQRFEVTISASISSFEDNNKEFEAIVSSIKIEK